MKNFDKIYIIDLHGNAKKKETTPEGKPDENVFDIQQGVSINIFVKTTQDSHQIADKKAGEEKKKKRKLAEVYHYDIYGKRQEKLNYLRKTKLSKVKFTKLKPTVPDCFFVPQSTKNKIKYERGFSLKEIFPSISVGTVTADDGFFINQDKKELFTKIKTLLKKKSNEKNIKPISYRPFDTRYIYYDPKLLERARNTVMKHFLAGDNVGIVFRRQYPESRTMYVFCSQNMIADGFIRSDNKGSESIAPLYEYFDFTNGTSHKEQRSNFNLTIIKKITSKLGIEYSEDKIKTTKSRKNKKMITPLDILDYIYGVLHNPGYREKYKEFLRIDFPRVPYPESSEEFWGYVDIGTELRKLHLMEGVLPEPGLADFPVAGDNKVKRPVYSGGKVYINDSQYFGGIPEEVWSFYIGGYQPAQKWLKARKDKILVFEDIIHYQKIIKILKETGEIMRSKF
jgi:predicted helicase